MDFLDNIDLDLLEIQDTTVKRPKIPATTFIPGHLQSPIYDDEPEFLLNNKSFECPRHRRLHAYLAIKAPGAISFVKSFNDPFAVLTSVVDAHIITDSEVLREYQEFVQNSVDRWYIHNVSELKPVIGTLIDKDSVYKEFIADKEYLVRNLHLLYPDILRGAKAEYIKDQICNKSVPFGSMIHGDRFSADREVFIYLDGDQWYLGPTNLLIAVLDQCQARANLLLYWLICDAFKKYPCHSILTSGTELIMHFENLRAKLGDDFCTFMKEWEGLVKGDSIRKTHPDLFAAQFVEMERILAKNDVVFDLKKLLSKSDNKFDMIMQLELVGITKIFAYPVLQSEKLLNQIKKHGSQCTGIDLNIRDQGLGIAKRDFIKNYHLKKGTHVKMISIPKEFKKYIDRNEAIPHKYYKDYHLWSTIVFDKNFDFDFAPDTSEFIKDSAAACELSSWGSMYDRCAFKKLYGKHPPPSFYEKSKQPRRVIEGYLKDGPRTIEKLINEIEEGNRNLDDKIAVECGKEKELTVESGRAFTKQTYNQRLVQVSLEHNIASSIFPYVPEQTMTNNELRVNERILKHNELMFLKGHEIMCIDFKKWNLKFTHEFAYVYGEMIDQLFGFKYTYKYSHLWFVGINIFTNNRLCPPDFDEFGEPIEGDFFTKGHIGGLEGLHQKKWTFMTIPYVKLAAENLGIDIDMLIQGDNLVLCISYPTKDPMDIEKLRKNFLDEISRIFNGVGHELKQIETWFSNELHEYGKQLHYRGASVSQGTKKASKLIPDINDGLFAHDTSLSSINTMTESLAREDLETGPSYVLNGILIQRYLRRKNLVKPSELVQCLYFPLDFGGIPLSSLHCHKVRGHEDKLTIWLNILMTLKENNPRLYDILGRTWMLGPRSPASSAKERLRLIEDIYCLNIPSLPSIKNSLKEVTKLYLQSDEVTNPLVKRLYSQESSITQEALIEALDTMEPFFVPLAHEIYANSNCGLAIKLRNKFTAVSTINKISEQYNNVSFIETVRMNNEEYKKALRFRLRRNARHDFFSRVLEEFRCPTRQAKELRELSWGKKFVNLTKPMHCNQVVIRKTDDTTLRQREQSIQIKCSQSVTADHHNMFTTIGPFSPYIGGMTREKIEKSTIDISHKTEQYASIKKLCKMIGYTVAMDMPNLKMLLNDLIDEKLTDLDKDLFSDISNIVPTVKSRKMYHRFISNSEKSYAILNSRPSVTTHFKQSSANLGKMVAGGKDYSVFYQYTYLANISALIEVNRICPLDSVDFCAELSCMGCCTEELKHDRLDIQPYSRRLDKNDLSDIINISEIQVNSPYSKFEVKKAFTLYMGQKFSECIGEDFKYHYMSRTNVQQTDFSRSQISINDFRLIDLKELLFSIILTSKRCLNLIINKDKYLNYIGNDESFSYFCHCVIESNRVPELFALLGKESFEHYETLIPEKMSSYVARNIQEFFFNHVSELIEFFDSSRLHDNDYPLRVPMQILDVILAQFSGKRVVGIENKCIEIYECLGKERPMIRSIKLSRVQTGLLWQMIDRLDLYHQPYVTTRDRVVRGLNLNYPRNQIQAFNRDRLTLLPKMIDSRLINFVCRPIGTISSASSKFVEILINMNALRDVVDHPDPNFYSLADGSGGLMTTLLLLNPNSRGFYNTWNIPERDRRGLDILRYPPAAVTKGIFDEHVFPCQYLIMNGETNIKAKRFLEKVEICMMRYTPYLLTIDLESGGNNVDVVEKYISLIIEYNIKIVIIKIYIFDIVPSLIDKIINDKASYSIVKPLSSDPTSNEAFLIITEKDSYQEFHEYYLANRGDLQKIKPKNGLTEEELYKYYDLSMLLNDCFYELIRNNKKLQLDTKMSALIEASQSCSIKCKKFLFCIMEGISNIDGFDYTEGMVQPAIRRRDINTSIEDTLKDLIFVLLVVVGKSLPKILLMLNNKVLVPSSVWRSDPKSPMIKISTTEGQYFQNWSQGKALILEASRMQDCRCGGGKYADIMTSPIYYRVLDNLEKLVMINQRELSFLKRDMRFQHNF